MIREMVIRQVAGYGWLPIVREFDVATGKPGREIYRGDFYPSPVTAACAGEHYLEADA